MFERVGLAPQNGELWLGEGSNGVQTVTFRVCAYVCMCGSKGVMTFGAFAVELNHNVALHTTNSKPQNNGTFHSYTND